MGRRSTPRHRRPARVSMRVEVGARDVGWVPGQGVGQ